MYVIIIGKRRGHEFERTKIGTWEALEARWRRENNYSIIAE